MKPWQVALAALAVLAVVAGLSLYAWLQLGAVAMSWQGWAAMAGGVVATLALGIGLMALVFQSNRRGYDDDAGH
jgi:hypothetical protein